MLVFVISSLAINKTTVSCHLLCCYVYLYVICNLYLPMSVRARRKRTILNSLRMKDVFDNLEKEKVND